jgi:hypothetical protein
MYTFSLQAVYCTLYSTSAILTKQNRLLLKHNAAAKLAEQLQRSVLFIQVTERKLSRAGSTKSSLQNGLTTLKINMI